MMGIDRNEGLKGKEGRTCIYTWRERGEDKVEHKEEMRGTERKAGHKRR